MIKARSSKWPTKMTNQTHMSRLRMIQARTPATTFPARSTKETLSTITYLTCRQLTLFIPKPKNNTSNYPAYQWNAATIAWSYEEVKSRKSGSRSTQTSICRNNQSTCCNLYTSSTRLSRQEVRQKTFRRFKVVSTTLQKYFTNLGSSLTSFLPILLLFCFMLHYSGFLWSILNLDHISDCLFEPWNH